MALMTEYQRVIGLVPAAGNASRIAPIHCSKEIYPVTQGDGRSKPIALYLLNHFKRAGAVKNYFVIRRGKWDIPVYFCSKHEESYNNAYIVTEATRGVPFTIDKAYAFLQDSIVLFGFPDIVFSPENAFQLLLKKQQETGADLVLGLFNADNPQKMDMVQFNEDAEVCDVKIKPSQTKLRKTWIIALWTPVFSSFLHRSVTAISREKNTKEVQLGDIFRVAIRNQMKICYVDFEGGRYLDIGTPDDLAKARHISWLK